MDRAGLVGARRPYHAGRFDGAYPDAFGLRTPWRAPIEADLFPGVHMVGDQRVAIDRSSIGLRYPRGEGRGVPMPAERCRSRSGGDGSYATGSKVSAVVLRQARRMLTQGRRTSCPATGSRHGGGRPLRQAFDADLSTGSRENEVVIPIEEGSDSAALGSARAANCYWIALGLRRGLTLRFRSIGPARRHSSPRTSRTRCTPRHGFDTKGHR